ncbi:hypothetical protein RM190_00585 [Paracoccus sp. CPCC 101403]|uniref:Uncharacterized protein n=1 Tax=Paracoccus broussonetiae TaxID=3075834 RepID=A0ABU3E7Y7_9RHOB|nr:hypothetical protein [Paracoccus sp. CPCC 101403]MDT1060329.1 hypothetical protein [Paracoccus sp. CPCC 101403]
MNAGLHECFHILAMGPALIECGVARPLFDDLRVLAYADAAGDGGCCLADHDALHHTVEARVLSLASIAPLASIPDIHRKMILTHPGELAVNLPQQVAQVALSPEDLAHAAAYDGEPLVPGIIVRATAILADRIGLSGRLTIAKLIGTMGRVDCEPPRLSAFVPFGHAESALRQARKELHERHAA